MYYSKWSISSTGNLFYNKQVIEHRKLSIVHLDDHKLFAQGLQNGIIPFFPLANIINIQNGDEALAFMKGNIIDKRIIDLILTDINHPGLKGGEFLQKLREFETKMNVPRTPAIIVSMVEARYVPQLAIRNIADHYFSKADEIEDIVEAMEDIVYPNKSHGG